MVVGEISNFKLHTSGHRYFTLKDDQASISCVMWRTRNLDFQPTDGMKVIVGGRLSVYAPRGSYQIDCAFMRPEGIGDLYAAFDQLKKKLAALGWFDPSRKKPLPRWPQRIGVATSQTGAAIRDVLSTIERRFPVVDVLLRPTLVQGEGAEFDIAKAIAELDRAGVDVIIVGRGGGSIEDLWSFNTEVVARAILECSTPIISAVGHETDTTIADYVADVRAATPTAAAEMVTPFTITDVLMRVDELQERMRDALFDNIASLKDTATAFLDGTALRRISERLTLSGIRTNDLTSRMLRAVRANITLKRQRVEGLQAHLVSLHPHRPLKLGFAIVYADGKAVPATKQLDVGDHVDIVRYQQKASVTVNHTDDIIPMGMNNG